MDERRSLNFLETHDPRQDVADGGFTCLTEFEASFVVWIQSLQGKCRLVGSPLKISDVVAGAFACNNVDGLQDVGLRSVSE